VAGWLEYHNKKSGEQFSLGLLSGLVPESKDAWPYTLDMLGRYFDRVRTLPEEAQDKLRTHEGLLELASEAVPDSISDLIGTYIELARLLGQRTGELHLALAADGEKREFAPEPFTPFYQRALYQSMRNLAMQNLHLLRTRWKTLPQGTQVLAEKAFASEKQIIDQFKLVSQGKFQAMRIRCHGDFHLGQVLYTGKDFVIIDFEGEPARPLGERRIKRSPFRDVAGMIRSFDYATYAALWQQHELGNLKEEQLPLVEPWTRVWYDWCSGQFLKAYLAVVAQSNLLPNTREELSILLNAHLLEKAIYELGYELNNRPAWVKIPLQGILQLVQDGKKA
jgi:maltose alpha-D-glucosyltransferase/alpha-amylase